MTETTATEFASRIARKGADAQSELDGARAALGKAVANVANNAKDLTRYLLAISEAEGKCAMWTRLGALADRKGDALTKELLLEITLDALTPGADDTWSGRGNDVARARFDGMRSVASDVNFL